MKTGSLTCSFLLSALSIVACGSSTGIPETSPTPSAQQPTQNAAVTCGQELAPVCSAATHVGSNTEFLAEINHLPWQNVSISVSGTLTISHDVVAASDLAIDASELAGPADCPTVATNGAPFPRCHTPLFRDYAFPTWGAAGRVPGVTCEVVGAHPAHGGDTCARILIAKGTTFRIRAVVEDMHPSAPTLWPLIDFERACAVPCDAGETRCGATQTCLAKGYASCAYCEGKAVEVCACRDACAPKADAASCSFASSPDVEVVGKCAKGSCVSTR